MKNQRSILFGLLLVSAILSAGWVGYQAKVKSAFQPESKLWFEGTSTLHDWKCEAESVSGFVEHEASGNLKVSGVQVNVPIDKLDCGHAAMNNRMKQIMKADQFPQVQFQLTSAKQSAAAASKTTLTTEGRLSISGVTKKIRMTVDGERMPNGAVRFEGSFPMKMSDFNLEAPTFLGISTGDGITVKFDVIAGGGTASR